MRALSALATDANVSFIQLVQLVRGETAADPRPNKALRPNDYKRLLVGYEHVDLLAEAAVGGLRPEWKLGASRPPAAPQNHQSANRNLNAIVRSVRNGQDAGQYLVVNASLLQKWNNVHVSPLGAVEKNGVDPATEVRLIQDLSFPKGDSVNTSTNRDMLPNVHYRCRSAVRMRA